MPYLAWSPTPGTSRPWTIVTYAFVHITSGHLLSNMFTLCCLTPTCSDIPGMNALHIIATVVGTSISGCAAIALETYLSPSLFSHRATYSIGASAINSGLTVLAALALPGEKSGVCLGQAVDLKFANWLLAAMAITSDVGSLAAKHFTEQGQRRKPYHGFLRSVTALIWVEQHSRLCITACHCAGIGFAMTRWVRLTTQHQR